MGAVAFDPLRGLNKRPGCGCTTTTTSYSLVLYYDTAAVVVVGALELYSYVVSTGTHVFEASNERAILVRVPVYRTLRFVAPSRVARIPTAPRNRQEQTRPIISVARRSEATRAALKQHRQR